MHWRVFTHGGTMSLRASRWWALFTSLYLFWFLSCLATVSPFELTLLHTNDNHARIEETSEDSSKCPAGGRCFAGVARRFTKVSEIRRREKNVLLLDAGDQFQGTVWFNYYKGAEAAHFMNKLGYDVMVSTFYSCDVYTHSWFVVVVVPVAVVVKVSVCFVLMR